MRQVALGAGHKYFVITWSDAAKIAQHAVRTRHKFLLSRCSEGDAPSFSEIELRFSFKNLSLEKKNSGSKKNRNFLNLASVSFCLQISRYPFWVSSSLRCRHEV